MRVKLAYGGTGLTIQVPEDRTTVIEPVFVEGLSDERRALIDALEKPLDSPPLRRRVKAHETVAIAVCDVTRAIPSHKILPVILEQIRHVPNHQITILVATGTHRPCTSAELEEMLGPQIVTDYRVVNHRSRASVQLKNAGTTAGGIPIRLNQIWLDSDFRITSGFVEPHFFAGFSGGPKMVAPGLAGLETIMRLHSAALIGHPNSTWGLTFENPIHSAIREIAGRTGVSFNVDVTINRNREITGVFAGDLFASHQQACLFARQTAMRPVNQPFEIVLTTNSGYPLDLNLYQAVKGMSAASRIVCDGGTIICAAECSDGVPEASEYQRILASCSSPEALLETINSPGYSRCDQWQAQIQAQIQLKARVYLKASCLNEAEIHAAHLFPVDDIEETLATEFGIRGPKSRLCVLPEGPQTIPYLG